MDHHDDPGFNSDPEQSDIADPGRDTEVESKQSLKNETAGQSADGRKDEHSRLCKGMKHHVEQQEDDKEYNRQNELQASLRPLLEFVFSRPFVGVACWQREPLSKYAIRALDEASIVFRIQVDVDTSLAPLRTLQGLRREDCQAGHRL